MPFRAFESLTYRKGRFKVKPGRIVAQTGLFRPCRVELGRLTVEGITNSKRGAAWSQRRILRGRADGQPFVIDADYLEGSKYLRINGVDQRWDATCSSYEAILSTPDQWRTDVPATTLLRGVYPNPRLAWLAFQLSGALWKSSHEERPIQVADLVALKMFDSGLVGVMSGPWSESGLSSSAAVGVACLPALEDANDLRIPQVTSHRPFLVERAAWWSVDSRCHVRWQGTTGEMILSPSTWVRLQFPCPRLKSIESLCGAAVHQSAGMATRQTSGLPRLFEVNSTYSPFRSQPACGCRPPLP